MQLYVLLFECYSDRSEWKQGLTAVTEALACVPPEFQVKIRTILRYMLTMEEFKGAWGREGGYPPVTPASRSLC